MSKIIFVSDFFANEMRRGAELCNQALLHYLDDPTTIESNKLYSIDSTAFYIITNFVNLPEMAKNQLIRFKNYLIYEHDHKYTPTRNPFRLHTGQENPCGIVPKQDLINVDFYKNAKIVICQTFWHEQQLNKNLDCLTTNIHGSFYLPEDLDIIESCIRSKLDQLPKHAFFNDAEFIQLADGRTMNQGNNIKNKKAALQYCLDMKLPYMPIPRMNNKINFWKTIAKYQHFIFFPDIPETCSRLLIEAKMLDVDVVTNRNSGAFWEDWFKLSGKELIDEFRNKVIPNAVKLFKGYINE